MTKTNKPSEMNLREEKLFLKLRTERKKLAHRRRRIIFNNDGDDLAGFDTVRNQEHPIDPKEGGTSEGFLNVRTTPLLGSHVDSVFYYSTWGMKLHFQDGPFGKMYRAECPENNTSLANYQRLMAEEGKDSLEIMIDTCHARGLEIFYSNRMNDCHDAYFDGMAYYIRKDHPEWCMGIKEEGRKFPYPNPRSMWSAWDFEIPEVRELTVEAMREVCRTYDIDGIELDFMRGLLYFRPGFELRPVEQKHIDLMADMVRKIRRVTEEEGLNRGRPILLAASAVADPAVMRNAGIDLELLMKENLIDLVTLWNCGVCTSPMKTVIDVAHRHNIPAYTMVNSFHKAGHYKDPLIWRGDAMVRWSEDADGIYTFNMFDPTLAVWWQLGEPEKLINLDKSYTWDFFYSQLTNGNTYWDRRSHDRPASVVINGKETEPFPLWIGENLSPRLPKGKSRRLTLGVHVSSLAKDHGLSIRVNGKKIPSVKIKFIPSLNQTPADVRLEYTPEPGLFKKGENAIKIITGNSVNGNYPSVTSLRLDVQIAKGTTK